MDTQIFVVLGFLGTGKTFFINRLLQDRHFTGNRRLLILMCEEGEENIFYVENSIASQTEVVYISQNKVNEENLTSLISDSGANTIIIEYNGIWPIKDIEWLKDRSRFLMIADSSTILSYNMNMRNLCYDKLAAVSTVLFNRCSESTDFTGLHKLVRGVSGIPGIAFEFNDGYTVPDTIQDTLPYSMEASKLEILDENYALWYRELFEFPSKYDNREAVFKCKRSQSTADNKHSVLGRQIMACCAEDTFFGGLELISGENILADSEWLIVTGTIHYRFSPKHGRPAPVLDCTDASPASPPEPELASL